MRGEATGMSEETSVKFSKLTFLRRIVRIISSSESSNSLPLDVVALGIRLQRDTIDLYDITYL